jgi:hypothetical protein
MYNIAKAAEAGMTGNPGHYRDFELPKPGPAKSTATPAEATPAEATPVEAATPVGAASVGAASAAML